MPTTSLFLNLAAYYIRFGCLTNARTCLVIAARMSESGKQWNRIQLALKHIKRARS